MRLPFLIFLIASVAGAQSAPPRKNMAEAIQANPQQQNAGVIPPEVVRLEEVQIEGERKLLTVGNQHERYHLTCKATVHSCVTPVSDNDYLVFSKTTRWQMPGATECCATLKFFQDFSITYNNQENIALVPATADTGRSFGMYVLLSAESASPQTARDYFNELKATNGVSNALNQYEDEYVCFDDTNLPSFSIIAKVVDMIQMMKQAGATAEAKKLEQSQFKYDLFVQKYYKGVGGKGQFYEAVGTEGTDYGIVLTAPLHGKMVYSINWATGRFHFRMYALDHSKTVPALEAFGKCELIHPDVLVPH